VILVRRLTWVVLAVLALAESASAARGGDFEMGDARGGRFRLADHRGEIVILYFGFTRCPDVCPTSLSVLAAALDSLGTRARHVLPLFVSFDPEQETPDGLTEYVRFFHPAIVPLLGTAAETANLARRYGVQFRKVPSDGALGYTMDHTAHFYLIDPGGRLVRILPHGTPASEIAKAIETLIQTR
jgi:protein SCO1/2